MLLVDTQTEFDKISAMLAEQKLLAIDTEFERTNTYFAKLALIQIATKQEVYIIDALRIPILESLKEIFLNNEILKIFHAPKQDLEIFWHDFGYLPKNIFDTQLAAKYVGYGNTKSYEDLCLELCSVKLDKTHQRSNWRQRPISEAQLLYAASDVIHLFPLFELLSKQLQKMNKREPYEAALADLMNENHYKINYANAWKKVKFTDKASNTMKLIQHLAAFREECAVKLNVPRGFIATDKELSDICKFLPSSNKALDSLNLRSQYWKRGKLRQKLIELCASLKEVKQLKIRL